MFAIITALYCPVAIQMSDSLNDASNIFCGAVFFKKSNPKKVLFLKCVSVACLEQAHCYNSK